MKTEAMTPTLAEKQLNRGNIQTLQKADISRRQKKTMLSHEIRSGMGDLIPSKHIGNDLHDSDGQSTANSRSSSDDNELVDNGNSGSTSDESANERIDEAGDMVRSVKLTTIINVK